MSVGDYPRVGEFLLEGHQSLRDDFESSCGEADRLVESAVRHGAWGARLTGAGWGGTVLVMAPPEILPALAKAVAADYRREVGRKLVHWTTRAAGGAPGRTRQSNRVALPGAVSIYGPVTSVSSTAALPSCLALEDKAHLRAIGLVFPEVELQPARIQGL